MKLALKILGGVVAAIVLLTGGLVAWGLNRWDRTFDAPLPALHATTDSAAIARGRYIAYGPGKCVECHTPRAIMDSIRHGATPPLSGGFFFPTPVGTFWTPNITPDSTTGIGRYSDAQLARAIRYGVRHDGRAMLPFMELQDLSDEDLVALLSFLRSQPAVHNEVRDHEFNTAGKMVMAFMMKPAGPTATPPAMSPPESVTVERGRYIAEVVAGCAGCHSKRSESDGSYQGPRYAGGGRFNTDIDTITFVSPNLTPSTQFGRITPWTEDQFVARFHMGPAIPGTPMPWAAFGRMSETDLRALYRFLKTLPPSETDPGPSVVQRKT